MEKEKEKQTQVALEKKLTKKEKKLLHHIMRDKAKNYHSKFKTQTRKSLLTALVAAFGFIIALAWKDVITGYVEMIASLSPIQGKIIYGIIVTIISVIGIILVTKFLGDD